MSNLIDAAILILSSYQTIPFKESTLTTLKRECIDVFRRNKSKELQEGKKKMNATHGQNFLCSRTVGKCRRRHALYSSLSFLLRMKRYSSQCQQVTWKDQNQRWLDGVFFFLLHTASFVCSFALLAILNPHHRDRQEHFNLFLVTTVYSACVNPRPKRVPANVHFVTVGETMFSHSCIVLSLFIHKITYFQADGLYLPFHSICWINTEIILCSDIVGQAGSSDIWLNVTRQFEPVSM